MGTLEPQWKLYVDGSSNEHRAGARVILISPKGHRTHYALRLGFKASNNKAEYEILIVRLRLVNEVKVGSIVIHSDSQFIVNQINEQY